MTGAGGKQQRQTDCRRSADGHLGNARGFVNETEPDVSEFSQTDDLILDTGRRLCRPRAAG
jgi:hypothetical protein